MSFKALRYQNHDVKYGLIDNSQTLSVGEVIIPGIVSGGDTGVVLTGGGTTGFLLGSVTGFRDNRGTSMEYDTWAAASNNVTSAMVQCAFLPLAIIPEWTTDLDDTSEVTDNSSSYGNFAVDSTGLLADESTWVAFSTRSAVQLFSYGLTGSSTYPKRITCTFFATVAGGL